MLEGTKEVKDVTDTMAVTMYTKLANLRQMLGLNILAQELQQSFLLDYCDIPIMWTRRLDVIGQMPDGTLTVVDYKTSGAGWKVIPSGETMISPQAHGFQSIGYLIDGPKKLADYGIGVKARWPKKIMYLVVGMRGQPQMFEYVYNDEDFEQFRLLVVGAATLLKMYQDEESFPKNRGKGCIECPVRSVCYQEEGWQTTFKEKRARDKDATSTA